MPVFFHQLADGRHFDAQKTVAFAVFTGSGFEEALEDVGLRGVSCVLNVYVPGVRHGGNLFRRVLKNTHLLWCATQGYRKVRLILYDFARLASKYF